MVFGSLLKITVNAKSSAPPTSGNHNSIELMQFLGWITVNH